MGILRQALTGEYQPHGLESDAKVILAFAFGRGDGVPGVVNEAIAEFAVKQAEQRRIGIVAQLAVADAIEQMHVPNLSLVRIDPRDPAEHHYMNSQQILDQATRLIDPETERVLVVAQAFHAPRADRQAQRTGFRTILPSGLPDVWDPDSIRQERHCRSAIAWAKREPFVIAHHLAAGWI
ncbi:MAG: hypothetical protein KIH63_002255 [Candidatus Saccharibacteria bacterium]|nr:hypothetical protein [Candidatus Saccharibacteria bacterium]